MAAFYNTATLSYRDTSTNSNTVEGQLVKVLSAEKNAVLPTYGSNDTVTYVISIRNSGSVAYTGLTITDDLGEYDFGEQTRVPLTYVEGSVRYYSNGTLQTAPTVTGRRTACYQRCHRAGRRQRFATLRGADQRLRPARSRQ